MSNNNYEVEGYLKLVEESKKDMFVPFDEIDSEIMGTAKKTFVMCKGKYLLDMFREIKNNPKTNFMTCRDEFIKDSTEDEFAKANISVVLKSARYDDSDYTTAEVAASKMAEVFGIITPYIDYVSDDKKIIMSVDFLSFGQDLKIFSEFEGADNLSRIHGVSYWIKSMNNELQKSQNNDVSLENKKRLILDLIRAFLIRRFILADNDLNSGNLGVIKDNKTHEMSLISFDYEFCFNNNSRVLDYTKFNTEDFMKKNIEWLCKNYPEEIKIVMNELSQYSTKVDKVTKILDSFTDRQSTKEYWLYTFQKNINTLINTTKQSFNNMESELAE